MAGLIVDYSGFGFKFEGQPVIQLLRGVLTLWLTPTYLNILLISAEACLFIEMFRKERESERIRNKFRQTDG